MSSDSESDALLLCTYPDCKRAFLDDAARAAHVASAHATARRRVENHSDDDDDDANAKNTKAARPAAADEDADSESQGVCFFFFCFLLFLFIQICNGDCLFLLIQDTTCPVCLAACWTSDALVAHLESEVR
jgi:hypothetical protein